MPFLQMQCQMKWNGTQEAAWKLSTPSCHDLVLQQEVRTILRSPASKSDGVVRTKVVRMKRMANCMRIWVCNE